MKLVGASISIQVSYISCSFMIDLTADNNGKTAVLENEACFLFGHCEYPHVNETANIRKRVGGSGIQICELVALCCRSIVGTSKPRRDRVFKGSARHGSKLNSHVITQLALAF
jgi:hypothetical protein